MHLMSDFLDNLKSFTENQLQCSICSEIFINPTLINCGHTFCEKCIDNWILQKEVNASCPICRLWIISKSSNQVLGSYIEHFIESFFPEDSRIGRLKLISERNHKKVTKLPQGNVNIQCNWKIKGISQNLTWIQSAILPGNRKVILTNHQINVSNCRKNENYEYGHINPNFDNIVDDINFDNIILKIIGFCSTVFIFFSLLIMELTEMSLFSKIMCP